MAVPADKLNTRTARPAAIRRASAQARLAHRRVDREYLERLADLYELARGDIEQRITAAGDNAGRLRLERMQELLNQINQRLRDLETSRNTLLNQGLQVSVENGIRPAQPYIAAGTSFTRISDLSISYIRNFIDEDGLQLSDRLWRIDRGARDAVGQAVEQSIILGHGASEAAADFLQRGEPVPADVQAKLGAASASSVASLAGAALMLSEGNAYGKALRVFRTELNRAFNHAYETSVFEVDDVVGTRFLLSPLHPRPDVCDMHANVNRYGLGKGVYPQGKNPYPAHPNTLGFIEAVFADEVSKADRDGKEDRIEWLKRQTPGLQQLVLGGRKKQAALDAGILKESHISTPWKILKQKYLKQGVDIDGLRPRVAETVNINSAVVPVTLIPSGSPVSGAFNVKKYARNVETVLDAIDSVHGDGRLPVIDITSAQSSVFYLGRYSGTHSSGMIKLRAGINNRESVLTHEIGHFIDHHGIPGYGFSSPKDKAFESWRRAVDSTPEVRALRGLLDGPGTVKLPTGEIAVVPKEFLRYLTSYEEMWARSYSQYIAVRSSNKVLLDQLDADRKMASGGPFMLPGQWQDDHFSVVAREIDKLFEGLGWLRK